MLLLLTTAAAASEPVQVKAGGAAQLFSVFLGLAAVIALIFILAWLVKRTGGGWVKSQHLKVVASVALGTRERLILVDAGGTQLLLGVTAHSINQLHVFAEPIVSDDEASSPDFAAKLAEFLPQKREKNNDAGH
ncbi:flagellar biosynthetic protein FliO [Gilvimarinus chinensis]|uniref:flagellar biosynthetic protein FliO n=1 Tax=Gilvimarinus chinensis TaxID=396005 RepID=UPI0003769B38|nr:flagellar biosynthetic protein FliO [Gilvimarinus chinensis]